jgi:glycosyltransferase involved in cell wall biosynthesis
LLIEKLAAVISDRIIALTEQERRDYIRYHVAPSSKLLTIHSGVTLARFMRSADHPASPRSVYKLPESGSLIGFIGWLVPNKGVIHLLNAMPTVCRRVPQARLIIVGKGDSEARLKQRSIELGLQSNVVFCGWRNDIHHIMPLMDVFVLPSLNEGMGRVLVEAMAAGRPVVASNTGGIPDLIRHGDNGLLVPPGDESALAAAILKLIQNPAMAKEMGIRGKARCREFGLSAMVEKIDRLYGELLEERLRCGRRSSPGAHSDGGRLSKTLGQSQAGLPQPATRDPEPETEPIN